MIFTFTITTLFYQTFTFEIIAENEPQAWQALTKQIELRQISKIELNHK